MVKEFKLFIKMNNFRLLGINESLPEYETEKYGIYPLKIERFLSRSSAEVIYLLRIGRKPLQYTKYFGRISKKKT